MIAIPSGPRPVVEKSLSTRPASSSTFQNNGSNNLSAYRIDPKTGALSAVSGSPFSAGSGTYGVAVVAITSP